MPKKSFPVLEELARTMVGDGQTPDLFFITQKGVVVAVDVDPEAAYSRWRQCQHGKRGPVECALENRTYGVIASWQPESDEPGARLECIDHYREFTKPRRKA